MKKIRFQLFFALFGVFMNTLVGAEEPSDKPKSIGGLLLWYPFCGNANDASGNGRHGIVHGAELTADRFGVPNRAYRMVDGSNGIDSPFQFKDPSAPRTFSIWFMTEDWGKAKPGYYKGYAGNGKTDLIYGVNAALSIWDNGTAGLDGPFHNAVFTGTPLAANQWHHVCLAYSGQMDTIKVWVNGKALKPQTEGILNYAGAKPIKNIPSKVKIPPIAWSDIKKDSTAASYDELRVYDYAFTETDAIRLFNEQRPRANAGCGSDTSTRGQTGNGNGQPYRIPGITPGISAPPVYFRTNLTPSARAILLPNSPRGQRFKVRSEGAEEGKESSEPIIQAEPAVAEQPVYPPGNLPEGKP